jgi:hypothetical protein
MNNLRSLGTVRILDRLNNPLRVGAGRHKNLLERVREGRDDKGRLLERKSSPLKL